MVTARAASSPRARFTRASAFQDDLKRRVDRYFERTEQARTGGWRMRAKAAVLLGRLAASYALLVFTRPGSSEVNVIFPLDAPPVLTEDTIAASSAEGESDQLPFIVEEAARVRFCARVDARTRCRPGDTILLSIDPARFHYFDPGSGLAVGAAAPAPVEAHA